MHQLSIAHLLNKVSLLAASTILGEHLALSFSPILFLLEPPFLAAFDGLVASRRLLAAANNSATERTAMALARQRGLGEEGACFCCRFDMLMEILRTRKCVVVWFYLFYLFTFITYSIIYSNLVLIV